MTTRRATSLRPGQFKHLIRVASVSGRLPEREASTGDVETVQAIDEHACLDHSKAYMSINQETIRRAYELAL